MDVTGHTRHAAHTAHAAHAPKTTTFFKLADDRDIRGKNQATSTPHGFDTSIRNNRDHPIGNKALEGALDAWSKHMHEPQADKPKNGLEKIGQAADGIFGKHR
jgi:hypothetical protein